MNGHSPQYELPREENLTYLHIGIVFLLHYLCLVFQKCASQLFVHLNEGYGTELVFK